MKHNRVVSIVFAVLAAIVLVVSPVRANGSIPSEPREVPGPWSFQQRDIGQFELFSVTYCWGTQNGYCDVWDEWSVVRIWREIYTDQYSYGCTYWDSWQWTQTQELPVPARGWIFRERGVLCRGEVRAETLYTPEIGRYEPGWPPYMCWVQSSEGKFLWGNWVRWNQPSVLLIHPLPSPIPFIPIYVSPFPTYPEGGGESARPIQPTATNLPGKGKKTPTPIPYP